VVRCFLGLSRTVSTRILDLVGPDYLSVFRTESLGVSLLVVVIRAFLGFGGAVATRIPDPDSGRDTFSFPGTVRLQESVSVTFARHLLDSEGGSRVSVFGNDRSRTLEEFTGYYEENFTNTRRKVISNLFYCPSQSMVSLGWNTPVIISCSCHTSGSEHTIIAGPNTGCISVRLSPRKAPLPHTGHSWSESFNP